MIIFTINFKIQLIFIINMKTIILVIIAMLASQINSRTCHRGRGGVMTCRDH
jgi:hypothetical protein